MNIKTKIIGMVGMTALIGIAGIIVSERLQEAAIEADRLNGVGTAATGVIDKIDRNLFERYGDVQAFALSEPARSGDRGRIVAFMNDMMPTYAPVYSLMTVVNSKGVLFAVNTVDKDGKPLNTESLLGRNVSESEWFKKNISGDLKPGTAYIEDLFLDESVAKLSGGSGAVMAFSTPIRNPAGKIVGVWRNIVSWKDVVSGIIDEELKGMSHFASISATLIRADGKIIVSKEADQILKADFTSPIGEPTSDKPAIGLSKISGAQYGGAGWMGIAVSKGYSSYPGLKWRLAVEVPAVDSALDNALYLGLVCAMILFGFTLFVYAYLSRLTRRLTDVGENLITSTQQAAEATISIRDAADSVASAVTEQAAAVQETAASMEEMNAMVRKSADNTELSRKSAASCQESVTRGRSAVQSMLTAMNQINSSNDTLTTRVDESNRKLLEVTKVIGEISAKTKVINEIVFQTKLLSFNASVEAARAGEHGKGFAVVAEEVGNLAQMSGAAAKEITDLLETSTQRVNEIVSETKSRVEAAMLDGRTKVESGVKLATECDNALEEVVRSVGDLGTMISEISTATSETATGLNEISKAIHQIDQTTHNNSAASNTSAQQGRRVHESIGQVKTLADTLNDVILGKREVTRPGSVPRGTDSLTTAATGETQKKSPVAKVVSLHRKVSGTEQATRAAQPQSSPVVTPMQGTAAVGADHVPSANDPRFEEV